MNDALRATDGKMENYSVLMTVNKNDSAQYFVDSVNSMLNQSLLTDDFVIICDGPIPNELNSYVEYFERKFHYFKILHLDSNVGLGAALKIGVPLCKNELIARMDADDIAKRERCEHEVKYLYHNPNCVLVGSSMNEFENDPNLKIRLKKVPIGLDNIKKYAKCRNPFNHSTVMFRKTAVIEAGNYSEMRTNQDVELWIRMLNKGYLCENLDETLVDFRFDSSTYMRRKDIKNIRLLLQVWKEFKKKGYCSSADYCLVWLVQMIMLLMPEGVIRWCYDRLR